MSAVPETRVWPAEGITRVPYWVYQDTGVYAREQERIYRGAAWNFLGLEAELTGVAFRRGIKGQGGMPEDARPESEAPRKLRVATFCGLMFATLSDATPPIERYIGPEVAAKIRRVMKEPVKVLGGYSQVLASNWKLYFENVKDTYHASLLHLFFSTFRLNRLEQKGGVVVGGDGGTLQILTVFPGFVLQQIMNCLAVRQVLPKGVNRTELVWTAFGYASDDEKMTELRMKQANLIGPAGYISLEDGAATAFVQRGAAGASERASFIEMGGRGVESNESRVTETSVRGLWQQYRKHMGL